MNSWAVFLIVLFVVLVIGFAAWIVLQQLRARRLGLPAPSLNPFASKSRVSNAPSYQPPAPATGGVMGWLNAKFRAIRNPRSSAGAYESNSAYRGAGVSHTNNRRGFDPLDPDEAWDTRVGHEADYTVGGGVGSGPFYGADTELGLRDPGSGPYNGAGYGEVDGRGRTEDQQRELDQRYEEEVHGGGRTARSNPFGDNAERSSLDMRDVSPRPERGHSRRSAFKEDM